MTGQDRNTLTKELLSDMPKDPEMINNSKLIKQNIDLLKQDKSKKGRIIKWISSRYKVIQRPKSII